MKFSDLALYFERIEATASRNDMIALLGDCLAQASAQEKKIITYLCLGTLLPAYQNSNFNIAQKGLVSLVAALHGAEQGVIENELKKVGDIGAVAQTFWRGQPQELSVTQVYDHLLDCIAIQGIGSTVKKEELLVELLSSVDAVSCKYIVRIINQTLRLGCSDMTILDALSWSQGNDKKLRPMIEHAYNVCADIGLVAELLDEKGADYLQNMQPRVGIPIRPAAAERLATAYDIIEKLGPCVAQPKLDGFRLQIHLDKRGGIPIVRFYSRNLVDMSEMFPDVYQAVVQLPVQQLICEGEAIGYDEATGTFLPFQETVKRKRKHGVDQASQEIPLRVFLFDVLFLDGQPLLNNSHKERRQILEKITKQLAHSEIQAIEERYCTTGKELDDYFLLCIQAGLEGLVVKREDAIYQPGKRNFNWIKLKRQTGQKLGDTLDCVILGYYVGQGKRAALGIGAFLVGVYNPEADRFESVAKVGTGMSDEQFKELCKKVEPLRVSAMPKNVWVAKELWPDVWVLPELVCVVRADDITQSPVHTAGKTQDSLGYALRFPRFLEYRIDKSARDTTSTNELASLYELQFSAVK